MAIYPRRYARDLVRTTSVRIDEELRKEAEEAAFYAGMTFSQFCRQALRRNISLYRSIEDEVARQSFLAAAGKR